MTSAQSPTTHVQTTWKFQARYFNSESFVG